jgi:molecular chaperone GrpE
MMKKKHREQEAEENKDNAKHTENKDNTQNNESAGSSQVKAENSGAARDNESEKENNTAKAGSELRATEEKLAEMQDRYIRLSAEFDNYRKRTLREKMDLNKYAGESLLLKLLPVMDDFERAVQHMDTATDVAAMKNGIDLIYVKLSEFLKQNGISEIASLNSTFNVDLHEAVAKVNVEENEKKGKVIDVIQKGYYLQDKVLRFSKVVVGE